MTILSVLTSMVDKDRPLQARIVQVLRMEGLLTVQVLSNDPKRVENNNYVNL
jgi:hypothetical protein